MNFFTPPWIRDRRAWHVQTAWTLAVAATEAGLGLWLKASTATAPSRWLVGLGALLAARVVLSWRRDLSRERLALGAGRDYHRRIWAAAGPDTGAWHSREAREWIEAGTRAAVETRSALATLALCLPLLVWLAPWITLAVLASAAALASLAKARSRRTRVLAKEEAREAKEQDVLEEWAHRSLAETLPSGWSAHVARTRRTSHETWQGHRRLRSALQAAWSAAGEGGAHAAGWILGAAALASWSRGGMDSGTLVSFLGICLLTYRPVREAGRLHPSLQKAAEAWTHRGETRTLDTNRPRSNAALVVRSLEAGWGRGPAILRNLDLRLEPGEMAVVHGPNGSGKSTLLSVLSGRLAPRAGLLEGPRRVFHLAQETVLPPLAPSAWTGIDNPSPDSLDGLVGRLFPEGIPASLAWNRPIPNGGQFLSRGQRTRLGLMAMVARPYGGWLLDEPMSALPSNEGPLLMGEILSRRKDAWVLWAQPDVPAFLHPKRTPTSETSHGPCLTAVDL
ncbi:MAG: ABC transporter ATP-binding protein/permease [Fibrobacterota bacterium]|nr:ABC transporter ATP-binding protein/permease [Fibrobacterota bacterium]QQS03474.1 MAG: ABC transporter ATP-binding protein/permease [Fibrobacterota bacterium]